MLSPVADSLDALRDAVRRAAGPQLWSRGVELHRRGAVQVESRGDEEIGARVATRGGLVSPLVTLFPSDPAWACECDSRAEACEHVAAVVIALSGVEPAAEPGAGGPVAAAATGPVAAAPPRGLVGYRFRSTPAGPEFSRVVVAAGEEVPLEASLVAIATGRVDGPAFMATPADLACDKALGSFRSGLVPRELWSRLLLALSRCRDVTFDGERVRASVECITPVVRLADHGSGFRLELAPDPRVSARIVPGVVRCGDLLHPFADAPLNAREREDLSRGLVVPAERVGWLVSELLPSLAARLPVMIETTRLPKTVRSTPRAEIATERDGDALVVHARVVYGDPPVAHLEGERLLVYGSPIPVRDEATERRLVREMEATLGVRTGVPVRLDPPDAIAFAERLRAWTGKVVGSAHATFALAPALVPSVTLDPERFRIDFRSATADATGRVTARDADTARVIEAWREGEPLVPLLDGGFAPLPAEWLERFGPLLEPLLAARAAGERLPRAAFPALARLAERLGEPAPAACAPLEPLFDPRRPLPRAALPEDLTATLRSYQREGIDWLAFLKEAGLGALLADDMGLGKTLQALAVLSGRSLVVCPASVVHNWLAEAHRFRPGLRAVAYHGAGRVLDRDADLVVTTYAILRLEADRLASEEWDVVVLDEAQAIKNPDSQTARAAFRLAAPFRLAMTGTPVENRLEELWSLFRFANPGLLGGLDDFLERHARPIAAGEEGAASRLRAQVRPFVLRRLKRDVAPELPPRTEVALYCALTAEERALYDAIFAATRDEVVARLRAGGGALEALEALLRLRQAACHRGLIPGQSAESSSKVDLLLDTLDTVVADGHKALVFSQWTSLLDLLEPPLARAGIASLRLDGATRDRAAVVGAFQDDAGPPVMLVSLKAGGTGINLTAADHVFLLDPWWNPAAEDQAADRAHRIGQDRPVLVTRLVAEGTVEERILELQERKRALAEAALGDGAEGARLTREDLLELLGG